jgi:hypothetical protein
VPEFLNHPRYTPCYEKSFDQYRRALGLAAANFDYFFREVETFICDYPRVDVIEMPGEGGMLMRSTREAWHDLPPLYIYYKVNDEEHRVRFFGLSAAWSADDFSPDDWF